MRIIVGLGNPGNKYARTRHNVGFMVVDQLAEEYRIPFVEEGLYLIGKGGIGGQESVLLKPLTYMNRSGTAVKRVLRKMNIFSDGPGDSLIVIHDDLDLVPGIIRLRRNGSSGGHRGIESIIQETGTRDFVRVKVGIGREEGRPVEEYVLGTFSPSEKKLIKDAIINAAEAVCIIVTEGIEKAMNRFNRSTARI
ncbi:MAG: aminoacyl-tRNA hydrolase [Alphaproteobacteria bacterium]|uniref:Peptidyl-tRNA hydrolase n=1 Tax=Candidatus Nitrobium versatile TaxID=2884831 RepID=A0A953JA16_9BACT|nr:aminoacyl-tRNA hydrolase [Candidatus Nitrobium versatile]